MTFDEYFKTVSGKGIDFDGNYGVQCFDLANDYAVKVLGCKAFIGLYAYEIYTNFAAQPSAARFTKIANTPEFIPKKGDIIVWAKSLNGTAGHVAVCTGEGTTSYFYSYDQNWTGRNDPCTKVKHDYSHVLGVLRPKEQSCITADTSGTVLDKDIWYKRGDKNDHGIYIFKRILKKRGYKLDDTEGFGVGTENAVKNEQRLMGYKQTGEVGKNFVDFLTK